MNAYRNKTVPNDLYQIGWLLSPSDGNRPLHIIGKGAMGGGALELGVHPLFANQSIQLFALPGLGQVIG